MPQKLRGLCMRIQKLRYVHVSGCVCMCRMYAHVQTVHGLQYEYAAMVVEQISYVGSEVTERRRSGVQGLSQRL